MKLLHQCVLFGAVASVFLSCTNESPWGAEGGEGMIRLDIEALTDVEAAVPKVRAISAEVTPPPVEEFSIRLTRPDGSKQTWTSVEEFSKETKFSAGVYELEAFYGDESKQGMLKAEHKGYEFAYYHGKTSNITVLEGQTTDVSVTPSLKNSIFLIEYTEAFKNYFKKGWETTLQSAGCEPITMDDEEGMTYITPGEVSITMKGTQPNGKSVMLNPGSYIAESNHEYKLKFNIFNGEVGEAPSLEISFDESLQTDPIIIDLSDVLGVADAPVVNTEGFVNGEEFVTQPGMEFTGTVKYNVVAKGTIAAAKLTIVSDSYNPSFLTNGEINLCGASEAQQAQMAAAGIKAVGFFRNPGQLAQLDLTQFCHNLPEGCHEIYFQVTDALTQTHEPVKVTVATIPLELAVSENNTTLFGDGYADITISYNGSDPTLPGKNPFTFQMEGDSGDTNCDIISINGNAYSDTRSDFVAKNYVYRVHVPDCDRDEIPVQVYFNGEKALRTTVKLEYPAYTMEYDALAKSIRMRINGWAGDANDAANMRLFNKLNIFIDGTKLNPGNVVRDASTGVITVPVNSSNTTYTVQTTLESAASPKSYGATASVTTEEELPVPNGNFSATTQTINETLQVGGQYKVSPVSYTLKCPMKYSEANGWASINAKTFYSGAKNANTWFKVVSTYVDGSSCVIRSVAYDHNGTTPATSGGAFSTTYYCTNAPSSFANRDAGELFLGSYSYNGTETRNYGTPFASRPATFKFNYTYAPYNTDAAQVEIQILDASGSVIGSKKANLSSAGSTTEVEMALPSFGFGKKASSLRIRFLSSTQNPIETYVPSGSALNEGTGLGNNTLKENSAHALSVGSVLTVSNLRFTY